MSGSIRARGASGTDATMLIERAAEAGVILQAGTAQRLVASAPEHAPRKVDNVCHVIRAGRGEGTTLRFIDALRRLEACGGNVDETVRRLLWEPAEHRPGVRELLDYAGDRGVDLRPETIHARIRADGREDARKYVNDLAAIMDAACQLGFDCPLQGAISRLAAAGGVASRAIARMAADRRRNDDRLRVPCQCPVPPRAPEARTQALAECGCKRCSDSLARHLQPYITKMLTNPYYGNLAPEEARSLAGHELTKAIREWPGGENFAGYYSVRFHRRVQHTYKSTPREEREMLSLDSNAAAFDDGREVTLLERVPDRTVDVAFQVELRDGIKRLLVERRELWEERWVAYLRSRTTPQGGPLRYPL